MTARKKIKSRTPEQRPRWSTGAIGACDVHGGSMLYTSRRHARSAAREKGEPGWREYRCDVTPGMWHIGRLPTSVRQGVAAAEDWERRVGREDHAG